MIHPPNTRLLLSRICETTDSLRLLARQECATHQFVVGAHLITFYRRTDDGGIEAAAAFCDGETWTLSDWAPRSVPRLPVSATVLA